MHRNVHKNAPLLISSCHVDSGGKLGGLPTNDKVCVSSPTCACLFQGCDESGAKGAKLLAQLPLVRRKALLLDLDPRAGSTGDRSLARSQLGKGI